MILPSIAEFWASVRRLSNRNKWVEHLLESTSGLNHERRRRGVVGRVVRALSRLLCRILATPKATLLSEDDFLMPDTAIVRGRNAPRHCNEEIRP
jgi:hypothetical protein